MSILGISPKEWRQRPDMTIAIDWDVRHHFKQTVPCRIFLDLLLSLYEKVKSKQRPGTGEHVIISELSKKKNKYRDKYN